MTRGGRGSDGFALIAVMLVLAVLGVVAVEFSYSMRLEASMARTHKEALVGQHLAEAGVEQAMREIMSNTAVQGLDDTGALVFYRPATVGASRRRGGRGRLGVAAAPAAPYPRAASGPATSRTASRTRSRASTSTPRPSPASTSS